MTTQPDWPAADRAYQHHHAACPQCRAAGTSPNTQQRCPEGRSSGAPINRRVIRRISLGCASGREEGSHDGLLSVLTRQPAGAVA